MIIYLLRADIYLVSLKLNVYKDQLHHQSWFVRSACVMLHVVYRAINYYSHCNATNQEKYINNLKHIALDIVHCLGSTVCGCGEGGKYAGVFLISAQRETHPDIRGLALITRTLTTTISVPAPQFKIDIS